MTNNNSLIHLKLKCGDEKLEAADWLAKLDRGHLTDDERKAFAQWLAEDQGNKEAIQEGAAFWYGLNEPLSKLKLQHIATASRRPTWSEALARIFSHFRMPAYAGVGMLFVCIALFYFTPESLMEEQGYYATQVGETRIIQLQDGSEIHLNTNSIIETMFSNKDRAVHLLSGEAIFDVAHDEKRPFKVYVADDVIRAVGTRFAVRLRPDKVSVTVTEGRVALEKMLEPDEMKNDNQAEIMLSESTPIIVNQGEGADIDHEAGSAKQLVSERDVAERLSWAQGQLVFYNKELQFVIDEVARYTRVDITISDETSKIQKITGILPLGDVKLMLEGLEAALGVKVLWISENHVQISAG